MTCERCGHEHSEKRTYREDRYQECIANLRADLTAERTRRRGLFPLDVQEKLRPTIQEWEDAVIHHTWHHEEAAQLVGELEAERARSWELARDLDLSKDAFRRLKEAYDTR